MSTKVHSLTKMIWLLEALPKERTPMPPLSWLSPLSQLSHPPPLLYHQADSLPPNPLIFSTLYNEGMPSYLPPGWPLPPPPATFAPYWEQLQNNALHLSPILWNPFWFPLQHHQPQAWMIVPIPYESYPLPSPFPQDPVTWIQSFWLNATHVDPLNTSAPTVSIIVAPHVDKLPPDTQTTSILNFIAPTVSSVVTLVSSVLMSYSPTTTPSWMWPGTSHITRSMREIEVLEMEFQDYKKSNVMNIWNPLPFSSLSPCPSSHSLWDMITNNKGISSDIWDQFVGGDVPSITF